MRKILPFLTIFFVLTACQPTINESAEVYSSWLAEQPIVILPRRVVVEVVERREDRCWIKYERFEGWTECDLIDNATTLEETQKRMDNISDLIIFVSILAAGIGLFYAIVRGQAADEKKKVDRLSNAESQYRQALAMLKESPDNAELRQNALELGRRYAELARKDKRTIFDEVALMNDLNAIPATGTTVPNEAERSGDDLEERLTKLMQLHSKKIISDDEYNERRSAILDEI